jgi:1-acyl-sn-glycerol-3-phosphate acyltransferase
MLNRVTSFLAYCILKLFFKLKVEGKEAVPRKSAFILASNHISNFDPPVLAAACGRKLNFLAKKELFKNRLFGAYIKALCAIPLEREKPGAGTFRICLKKLKRDGLLVFPQGSRGGSFEQAFSGVGFLAKKAMAPVVAARVYGTEKILPKGAKLPAFGQIRVVFKPVEGINYADSHQEITARVVETISAL